VTDTPLVAGPLYGLRTWVVVGEPGAERLAGPQRREPWPAGGVWLEAQCAEDPSHVAPVHDCACGLHAWHPDVHSARKVLAARREVAGVVECDGAIEVHAEGFRAQRARPHAIVLSPMRNAALIRRLADAYDAEVAEVDGPEALAAWCSDRGLGIAPAVIDDLLGPGAAEQARRERRRRSRRLVGGMLAWMVVSALLAAAAAVALPDPSGPRDIVGRGGHVHIP